MRKLDQSIIEFFSKLTDEERLDIAKRYKNKEFNVTDFGLLHGFNLKGCSFRQLLGYLPTGFSCDFCNGMCIAKVSISGEEALFDKESVHCSCCQHYPLLEKDNRSSWRYYSKKECQCEKCLREKELKENLKREMLREEEEKKANELKSKIDKLKPFYECQNIFMMFGFGALFLSTKEENYKYATPLSENENPLMPTISLISNFLNRAYLENILYFVVDEKDGLIKLDQNMYFNKFWETDTVSSLINFLTDLAKGNSEIREHIITVFLLMQLNECVSYLQYIHREYSIDGKTGEKTFTVFYKYLEEGFSPSEIFASIWLAAKNACAAAARRDLYKNHQSNLIVSYLDSSFEKFKEGRFRSYSYNRPKDLFQSYLSMFFMKILDINEDTLYLNKHEFNNLLDKRLKPSTIYLPALIYSWDK